MPEVKDCAVCGRQITWRAAWARDWESVRHCSAACRRRARSASARAVDAGLDRALRELLDAAPRGTAVDPDDAARAVAQGSWRELHGPARAAARRLVAAGSAQITQGGRVVDPSTARGPVRVRRLR